MLNKRFFVSLILLFTLLVIIFFPVKNAFAKAGTSSIGHPEGWYVISNTNNFGEYWNEIRFTFGRKVKQVALKEKNPTFVDICAAVGKRCAKITDYRHSYEKSDYSCYENVLNKEKPWLAFCRGTL